MSLFASWRCELPKLAAIRLFASWRGKLPKLAAMARIPPDICHSPNTVLMNSSSKNNVGGMMHISCTECQKADVTPIVDSVIPRLLLKAKTHGLRVGKESAMKAIGFAQATLGVQVETRG
ncbi:hypothetical protein Tco_1047216 [Tanacetum coccineum]